MRILWLTDLHLLAGAPVTPDASDAVLFGVLNIYQGAARLAARVDRVNAVRPDLAICTGDIVDSHGLWRAHLRADAGCMRRWHATIPGDSTKATYDASASFALFRRSWERIDPAIPKYLTVGNHDVMALPHEQLAEALGHEDRATVAGSRFNAAHAVSGGETAIRLLMVDSNLGADRDAWCYTGRLRPEILDWIRNELSNAAEETVLLCMHHGPHRHDAGVPQGGDQRVTQFDGDDAMRLRTLVDEAAATRRGLRVHCLFGHEHGNRDVRRFDNLGPNLPGILSPCVIDYAPGLFTVIDVFPDGSLTAAAHSLKVDCRDGNRAVEDV